MPTTLGFDVYGTLIDANGVVKMLQEMVSNAADFSRMWREKQLEYSFRRGLMQNFETFAVCTRDALNYTCRFYQRDLTREQKEKLLQTYRALPPFEDVKDGIAGLKAAGFRIYAFSNGSAGAVETLLSTAGIRDLFAGIVSVDEVKTFKPSPAVYSYFLRKTGSCGSDAWLISSNTFDVLGAISFGMKAVWVKRSEEAILDPWGIEPTLTVGSLRELAERLVAYQKQSS